MFSLNWFITFEQQYTSVDFIFDMNIFMFCIAIFWCIINSNCWFFFIDNSDIHQSQKPWHGTVIRDIVISLCFPKFWKNINIYFIDTWLDSYINLCSVIDIELDFDIASNILQKEKQKIKVMWTCELDNSILMCSFDIFLLIFSLLCFFE